MRRWLAAALCLNACLPAVCAREFDFSRPASRSTPTLTSPGETRVIPPPPVVPERGAPAIPAQPVATPAPAVAVPRFDVTTSQFDLPKGTRFDAAIVRELIYSPSDALAMTLEVAGDVVDSSGEVVIPKGSTVWGSFQPVFKEKSQETAAARRDKSERTAEAWPEGSRFVADRVAIGERIYQFRAQTEVLPNQQDPRRNVGAEAGNGALIGVAGGALISIFTGGLGLIPVLAAGGLGAGVGAAVATQPVVIVKPDKPLTLTLVEPLRVR